MDESIWITYTFSDAYHISAALEGVAARIAAERGLRPDEKALIEGSADHRGKMQPAEKSVRPETEASDTTLPIQAAEQEFRGEKSRRGSQFVDGK